MSEIASGLTMVGDAAAACEGDACLLPSADPASGTEGSGADAQAPLDDARHEAPRP